MYPDMLGPTKFHCPSTCECDFDASFGDTSNEVSPSVVTLGVWTEMGLVGVVGEVDIAGVEVDCVMTDATRGGVGLGMAVAGGSDASI